MEINNLMHNYKISFFCLALCVLSFSNCKKDSKTTDPIVPEPDNTWALSDFEQAKFTTFTVGSSSHYDFNINQKGLLFKDAKTGSKANLYILFKTIPTTAGTYKIVRYSNDTFENDNECKVIGANESGSGFYCFSPDVSDKIEITVKQGGKLAITIPEINVSYAAPSGVYKLKATVYEK
ncbi:hypothetical protein ACFQZI_13935 [Mucilaginibacter lutimaris]|uniref:Lipocalin-like domain-containing protein n=1 Tax=Mucilaginibacter lutimaris TaxID=931629 RepID=A0ABW2ZIF8_9SPHI